MTTRRVVDKGEFLPHTGEMRETTAPKESGALANVDETGLVELWSRSDDRAVINLVPPAVGAALLEAGKARPDLFQRDERDLYKQLRGDNKQPTATDNRIRLRFWDEYDRAQGEVGKMNMSGVFAGVCTREYFYGRYLQNPEKVAWMACPPASYEVKMEEALAFGIEQLRDILDLPVVSPYNGKYDVKLGELKAKIVAMLDVRVKGATIQRVENRNMNLNISTSDAGVAKKAMMGTMADVEKRIKELEKRDRSAAPVSSSAQDAEIIDVG